MPSIDPGEAESRLRISIDNLLEGVQVIAPDWTYLYLNAAAAGHGRREVSDLVGRTMMECYPGIETTEMFTALSRVMESREPSAFRTPFLYADGQERLFDLRIEPVPAGACVISMDVTEQHALQTEMREERERTRFAMSAAKLTVWEIDLATETITCDMSHGGRGSWPLAEVMQWAEPDEQTRARETLEAARTGQFDELSLQIGLRPPPDGRYRIFEVHSRVLRGADSRPAALMGVSVDVTARSAMETQMQEGQRMEAMGRLAAGIAHDFNNQLTAILGFCDLAMSDVDADSRLGQDLNEIRTAAERSAALTRQLQTFGRRDPVSAELLDLNQVVNDLHRLMRRLLTAEISCELNIHGEPLFISGDRGQLEHLLTNLVVNAGDAMPTGGRLSIATSLSDIPSDETRREPGRREGRFAVLTVTDSGHGMDEATRVRIFEPFFTTKPAGHGTGLGLATVYGIVRQMNGFIQVDSTLGAGTSFRIHFPSTDPNAQAW